MAAPISRDGDQLQQRGCIFEDDDPDENGARIIPKRKKRKLGASEALQVRVIKIIEQNPMCPPSAIVKHKVWLNDPELAFKSVRDREIVAAIDNFTNRLTTYSMNDYQELYNKPDCNPIFSAGFSDNVSNYYYNIENSIEVLDDLVAFQCDNDPERIHEFMVTLYNVLERKVPKLNCIVIFSPPSAGKNFFFDCVKDYYLNVGHMCNANKYNTFAFQDMQGRRLVLWNEPNYSHEYTEQIKELLGGDSTNVNVKYMQDVPIYRTPVIVLTNREVGFMTHPAFNDRIRIFKWSAAPYLKDYDKKPNPLAIYHLFKRYNLVE